MLEVVSIGLRRGGPASESGGSADGRGASGGPHGEARVSPGGRPRSWPAWARAYLRVFRGVVVGACVVGVIFGWLANIPWLLAASACIGVGELIESTYYLVVLDWGARSGRIQV